MTFKLHFPAGSKLKASSGILYEGEKADGSDCKPMSQMGPQRFECSPDSCFAMAYGFQSRHILEIKFSDGKTRRTPVFGVDAFDAVYDVTVNDKDLKIQFNRSASRIDPPSRGR